MAARTNRSQGWIKGEPQQFVRGHYDKAKREARRALDPNICTKPDCDQVVHGHALCQSHYDSVVATPRRRTGCSICGGPKPPGNGRKLCDSVECHTIAAERAQAKRSEYHKRHYEENRDKILAREARRREEGGDEYRRRKAKAARDWARANPERYRENHRRYFAKTKYGLTLEEYDAMLERGCAICGTHQGSVTRSGEGMPANEPRLCIDHCHTTGKVRDALCHKCNAALGLCEDDPARLRAAADYLESHR